MARIEEVVSEVLGQEIHECEICGAIYEVYKVRISGGRPSPHDPPFMDFTLCKVHKEKYCQIWESEGYKVEILERATWGGVPR